MIGTLTVDRSDHANVMRKTDAHAVSLNSLCRQCAPMPGVFPDPVPVIRNTEPGRELMHDAVGMSRRDRCGGLAPPTARPSPTFATRRLSNAGAVIFIALVVIAVAVMLMA